MLELQGHAIMPSFMLKIQPGASCLLDNELLTELHPQPFLRCVSFHSPGWPEILYSPLLQCWGTGPRHHVQLHRFFCIVLHVPGGSNYTCWLGTRGGGQWLILHWGLCLRAFLHRVLDASDTRLSEWESLQQLCGLCHGHSYHIPMELFVFLS